MKQVPQNILDHIRSSPTVQASTRVIAEWNMNRYSPIEKVFNNSTLSEYDVDCFPITSIVEPLRPTKAGIVKARTGSAGGTADAMTTSSYSSSGPRYLTSRMEDKYKYWSSPRESLANGNIEGVLPTVIFKSPTWCNKITVMIENSYSAPAEWSIEYTLDGTNWLTAATNPTISSGGRVSIYRQPNDTWGYDSHRENPAKIKGVRLAVAKMNKPGAFLGVIEISARLESDLSPFVKTWSLSSEIADRSLVTPLGVMSSNEGEVVFSNVDNRFNDDNPASLYYGLIGKHIKMTIDVGITTSPFSSKNKSYTWVRQAVMHVSNWSGSDLDERTASLSDSGVFLQSIKPEQMVLQNMSISDIVCSVMDSIGMTNYNVSAFDDDPQTNISYFWTTGEETVWDVFNTLAQDTQTALSFDHNDVLQITTRDTIYNSKVAPVWQFDGVKSAGRVPDIISLDKTYEYSVNTVNIEYRDVKPADKVGTIDPMSIVWEPEGDVVLRSAPLTATINKTQQFIHIGPNVNAWPYSGIVQIEGEMIEYEGKGYAYYTKDNKVVGVYIKSEAEKIALDKINPAKAAFNTWTGYIWATKRGAFSTVAKDHYVDATGYTGRVRYLKTTPYVWNGGFKNIPGTSVGRISTPSNWDGNRWLCVTRGYENPDIPPVRYGARLKFPKGANGISGMVISAAGAGDSGYFVELFKTDNYDIAKTARSVIHELSFYVKYNDGSIRRLGPEGGKGVPINIASDTWYDLDISARFTAKGGTFTIYINGVVQMNVTVPDAQGPLLNSGRWGIFQRGYGTADYDYIYASNRAEDAAFDGASVYNRITGGYQSNQLDSEWIYNSRASTRVINGRRMNVTEKYNQLVIDDFGPIVHEMRQFDVKFDISSTDGPSLYSRLYSSNDSQIVCPEYVSSPFGAKFVLANASRTNAVANGQDEITFGVDNPVEQRMFVYGRVIAGGEQQNHTVKDEQGIRRNGEIAVDVSTNWIQSKNEAVRLGNWITKHWSPGVNEIEIESFMNPYVSVGDIVTVNFPAGHIPVTHRYFVVGETHSFDNGMGSQYTLRRIVA